MGSLNPRTLEGILFIKYAAVRTASHQKYLGAPLVTNELPPLNVHSFS